MSLEVSLKVSGNAFSEINKLSQKIDRTINLSLKDIGKELQTDARRRIAVSKTDPAGVRWAPWSFATLESRIRRGTAGRGLLYDSGKLWRSINYNVRGNVLELGSTVEYAEYLQKGRQRMPARQIVNMNTPRVKKVVKKHLVKQLKKAFK